jgi:hypothetical protein
LRKWRDWVRHLAVHGRNPTGSILPPPKNDWNVSPSMKLPEHLKQQLYVGANPPTLPLLHTSGIFFFLEIL